MGCEENIALVFVGSPFLLRQGYLHVLQTAVLACHLQAAQTHCTASLRIPGAAGPPQLPWLCAASQKNHQRGGSGSTKPSPKAGERGSSSLGAPALQGLSLPMPGSVSLSPAPQRSFGRIGTAMRNSPTLIWSRIFSTKGFMRLTKRGIWFYIRGKCLPLFVFRSPSGC